MDERGRPAVGPGAGMTTAPARAAPGSGWWRARSALARRARTVGAAVATGGAIGALLRLVLDEALGRPAGGWPWATFTANMLGCAALGYLATRLLERLPPSTHRRPLLGTGMCGALSTFSTVQVEAIGLARNGRPVSALAYGAISIAGGLVLAHLGSTLARRPSMLR